MSQLQKITDVNKSLSNKFICWHTIKEHKCTCFKTCYTIQHLCKGQYIIDITDISYHLKKF